MPAVVALAHQVLAEEWTLETLAVGSSLDPLAILISRRLTHRPDANAKHREAEARGRGAYYGVEDLNLLLAAEVHVYIAGSEYATTKGAAARS